MQKLLFSYQVWYRQFSGAKPPAPQSSSWLGYSPVSGEKATLSGEETYQEVTQLASTASFWGPNYSALFSPGLHIQSLMFPLLFSLSTIPTPNLHFLLTQVTYNGVYTNQNPKDSEKCSHFP